MQIGTSSNTTTSTDGLKRAEKQRLRIPWWSDLDPAVADELELPSANGVPMRGYDVVVIGGGVAGLSAALAIKQQDAALRVLVLEKEEMLGLGATGRNAGIFTPGVNMAYSEMEPGDPARMFYPETTALFHQLITAAQEPGSLLYARKTGAINMATSKRGARKLEWEVQERNEVGLHAELWTPAQVIEATQARLNTQTVVNAMWLPDEGRIHPLTLLAYLARRARQAYGITIIGRARVLRCDALASPSRWQLTLASGSDVAPVNGIETMQARAGS